MSANTPRRSSSVLVAVGIVGALMLAVPAAASASDECLTLTVGLRAGAGSTPATGAHRIAAPARLRAFCRRMVKTLVDNGPNLDRRYSPAKQRLIRSLARRVARDTPISRHADIQTIGLNLRGVLKYAGKALAVVKKVAGGASKLIPQSRLLRCGLFGGLALVDDLLKSSSVRDTLVDTFFACFAAVLPGGTSAPPEGGV